MLNFLKRRTTGDPLADEFLKDRLWRSMPPQLLRAIAANIRKRLPGNEPKQFEAVGLIMQGCRLAGCSSKAKEFALATPDQPEHTMRFMAACLTSAANHYGAQGQFFEARAFANVATLIYRDWPPAWMAAALAAKNLNDVNTLKAAKEWAVSAEIDWLEGDEEFKRLLIECRRLIESL